MASTNVSALKILADDYIRANGAMAVDSFREATGMPTPAAPPSKYVRFFDDFMHLETADTGPWVFDATNATVTLTTQTGGVLALTCPTTDNDQGTLVAGYGAAAESGGMFQITAGNGKPLWFTCRFAVSTITDFAIAIGLGGVTIGTDEILGDNDGIIGLADFLAFNTLVASPSRVDFETAKDTTGDTTNTGLGTLTASATTFHTASFFFDGVQSIYIYFDGVLAATRTSLTDVVDDLTIAPFIAAKVNATAGGVLYVDYIECIQARNSL